MESKIVQVALDLMAILIPVLAAITVELLRRKLGTEKLRQVQEELASKKEMAVVAVRFVEQVYVDLHSAEKYDKAAEWLSARLLSKGLDVSAGEIKGLIEAALRELKDSFGEEWAKAAG